MIHSILRNTNSMYYICKKLIEIVVLFNFNYFSFFTPKWRSKTLWCIFFVSGSGRFLAAISYSFRGFFPLVQYSILYCTVVLIHRYWLLQTWVKSIYLSKKKFVVKKLIICFLSFSNYLLSFLQFIYRSSQCICYKSGQFILNQGS